MPRLKLTKTVVESAQPEKNPYESATPRYLASCSRSRRLVARSSWSPMSPTTVSAANQPIGRFGEITVEQARAIAQDWLADARKGKDPGAEKSAARQAPTVKE